MFRGSQTISVDSKGRISMPTKHRDALTPMVLAPNPMPDENCLLIYPLNVWKNIEERITALPNNKENRKIKRLFLGKAEDVTLDGNGRLLIKPDFRKFAQLEKKAILVGQGDKLELWDENTWNAMNAEEDDEQAFVAAMEELVF